MMDDPLKAKMFVEVKIASPVTADVTGLPSILDKIWPRDANGNRIVYMPAPGNTETPITRILQELVAE